MTLNTTRSLPKCSCLLIRLADSSVSTIALFHQRCLTTLPRPDRLEASRKYLFGSVGVLGTNNDSMITGVFITRGHEIQQVIEVAPDWESYSFEKLDPFTDGSQKEFFEAAMAWDLEIAGKKWADGKNVSIPFLSIVGWTLSNASYSLSSELHGLFCLPFTIFFSCSLD